MPPVYLTWDNFQIGNDKYYRFGGLENFQFYSAELNNVTNIFENSSSYLFSTWDHYLLKRIRPKPQKSATDFLDRLFGNMFDGISTCVITPHATSAGGGWWFDLSPTCASISPSFSILVLGEEKGSCEGDCKFANLNAKIPYYPGIEGITGIQMKIRPM